MKQQCFGSVFNTGDIATQNSNSGSHWRSVLPACILSLTADPGSLTNKQNTAATAFFQEIQMQQAVRNCLVDTALTSRSETIPLTLTLE